MPGGRAWRIVSPVASGRAFAATGSARRERGAHGPPSYGGPQAAAAIAQRLPRSR
ncbi:hypothetical protein FKP32DRAFT_1596477 [Trametes sanguinea]|nr:hypothetical protein FKP32DRAFT_1596477 [Trametes sanguinea]